MAAASGWVVLLFSDFCSMAPGPFLPPRAKDPCYFRVRLCCVVISKGGARVPRRLALPIRKPRVCRVPANVDPFFADRYNRRPA
jgi:hypothetical protein